MTISAYVTFNHVRCTAPSQRNIFNLFGLLGLPEVRILFPLCVCSLSLLFGNCALFFIIAVIIVTMCSVWRVVCDV